MPLWLRTIEPIKSVGSHGDYRCTDFYDNSWNTFGDISLQMKNEQPWWCQRKREAVTKLRTLSLCFSSQIITDYVFLCPSRRSARAGTAVGSEVWMYVFDHVASDHRVWSGLRFCYHHACHGAELPFLFDSASVANFTLSFPEKLLSNRMLCYWGAFAHSGDPSSQAQRTSFCREQHLHVWPRYSGSSDWLVMNLTVGSHAQAETRNHMCDFWDQLGVY